MTATLKVSASSLFRLRLCLASGLLTWQDYKTAHAEAGTASHGEHEAAIGVGDLSKLPVAIQELLEGLTVRAEVAVVYDIATHTAREIGQQLGRSYGTLKPYEIPGTADVVGHGNGRLVIVDHKRYELVDDPEENEQTLFYALAFALVFKVQHVTVAIHYTERPDMPPVIVTLEMIELEAFAVDVRALYIKAGSIPASQVHAHENPGPKQCKYCPAFLDCNEQKKLALDLQNDVIVSTFNSVIPFENDDEASAAFELKERVRLWLKRWEAALAARAISRPIPLSDGRMYGERESLGARELDGDKAYVIVRDLYSQEVADAAVSRSISQASIERALKAAGQKGIEKRKAQIIEELDKLGGVTQKRRVELGIYPAAKQLKAGNG